MSEASLWPYTERNGVNASADIDSLIRDPEVYLDDQEKAAAYAFAKGLYEGYISDDLQVAPSRPDGHVRNLQEINQTSVAGSKQTFYVDYFKTDAAREDVASLGIDLGGEDTVREQLYGLSIDQGTVDAKVRKQIAARSLKWYKNELADRLGRDQSNDALQPDGEVAAVDFAPETLFDKFSELQAYRMFYRQVRRSVREDTPSSLNDARMALLEIHFARVNSLVAELYSNMYDMAQQISSLPSSEMVNGWRERLIAAAPLTAAALEHDEAAREQYVSDHLRRLDLVRNGAAAWEGHRNYLPISWEVERLAIELSNDDPAKTEPTPHLDAETIEYMKNTKWNADQMKQFCEAVLGSWDMLSEHQTDWESVDERSGFATDEKWQVVITPKVSSFSVNGKKKVISVPDTFDRTLIQVSPSGALPVSAHELSHIWQHEFSFTLAKLIPIAAVKGKRYITAFEMGGIHQERALHEMVGQERPTSVTYLRALEAKLSGANQTEAARAFAEAKGDGVTEEQKQSAGKNVLRLYRNGGHDSQALDYIEQELLRRSLSQLPANEVMAVSIAGGSFSLRDAASLHRFGLFQLPRQIKVQPAHDVMDIFLRDFYPSL
jgi:hypothetical protein